MRFYLFLLISFNSLISFSQCLTDLKRLLPERNSRQAGYEVALGGNYMVVGNLQDDSLGYVNGGSAYVYEKSAAGWNYVGLLHPSNITGNLQFGYQVKIDSLGETIAIGSYGYGDGVNAPLARGDIYVFQKPSSGWTSMAETDRIPLPDSLFTLTSIDLSSDGLRVVGGKYYTDKNQKGKVYLYTRNSISEKFSSKIPFTVASGVDTYSFGSSIAINKRYLVVSSDVSQGVYNPLDLYKIQSDTLVKIARLTASVTTGSSSWNPVRLKGNVITMTRFTSDSRGVFIYAKHASQDWKDGVEEAYFPLVDNTKTSLSAVAMILDSLTVAVVSSYTVGAPVVGSAPVGYVITFSKPQGGNWKDAIRNEIFNEQLPPDAYNKSYATSSAWNGSQLVFTPSLNAGGSNIENAITSLTRSAVWGSKIKVFLPRFNSANNYFGHSLAINNRLLFVGNPHDSELSPNAGALYIYKKNANDWIRQHKILPTTKGVSDTFFGGSIAIKDNSVAIGAINYSHNGKVFLYQKTDSTGTLQLTQEILPPADGIYQFGDAIALAEKFLVVSAFNAKGVDGTNNSFVVYEKDPLGWSRPQVVDIHNAWLHYQTMRLDVKGDTIFAYTGAGGYLGTGSGLSIFTKDLSGKWIPTSTFELPQNGYAYEGSFKVTDNNVFLGLPNTTTKGNVNTGSVSVYTKRPGTSWPKGNIKPTVVLFPKDSIANGYFGYSVDVIENTLVVGAPGSDYVVGANNAVISRKQSGATYVLVSPDFNWKTTTQLYKFQGAMYNVPFIDHMGWAVAATYDNYISSARFETNELGSRAGAVYTIPTPPLIKLIAPLCEGTMPLKLFGYPFGGTWSGPGLVSGSNGTFDPQLVGVGKYLLAYKTPNCTYEGKLLVEVLPNPSAVLASPNSLTICPTNPQKISVVPVDSATYQWYYCPLNSNSVIAISGQTKPDLTVGLSGYYYCLVTKGGCSVPSPSVTVNYETASASIGPQNVVCDITKSIPLTATPTGGKWSGYGVVDAIHGVFNPNGLVNGKYPVTYSFTSQSSCKYSLRDTILVDTIPKIKLKRIPYDFCMTGLVTIQTTPSVKHSKYSWKYKANNQSSWLQIDTISLPKRNFVEGGYYECIVSNIHCGTKSDSLQIGQLNDLSLTLHPKDSIVEICLESNATLSVTSSRNDAKFSWFGRDSTETNYHLIGEGDSLIVSANGFYKVSAKIGFCSAESGAKYVQILPRDSVWAPNVFTPNGDELNPVFKVKSNVKAYSLLILNRWGQEIFWGRESDAPWDGANHPTGTYFWFIEYKDCLNKNKTMQGSVVILR
jgi:gliding motility-associated-like protein